MSWPCVLSLHSLWDKPGWTNNLPPVTVTQAVWQCRKFGKNAANDFGKVWMWWWFHMLYGSLTMWTYQFLCRWGLKGWGPVRRWFPWGCCGCRLFTAPHPLCPWHLMFWPWGPRGALDCLDEQFQLLWWLNQVGSLSAWGRCGWHVISICCGATHMLFDNLWDEIWGNSICNFDQCQAQIFTKDMICVPGFTCQLRYFFLRDAIFCVNNMKIWG